MTGMVACSHLAPYVQGPLPRPPSGDPEVTVVLPAPLTAISRTGDPIDGASEIDIRGPVLRWSLLGEPGSGFFLQVATESGPVLLRVVIYQSIPWSLSPGTPVRLRHRSGPDGLVIRLDDARGPLFFLAQGSHSLNTAPLDSPLQVRPRSSQAWIEVWEDEALCRIVTSHRSGEAITPGGQVLVLTPGVPQDALDGPDPFRVMMTMNRKDLENSCGDALVSRFGWWWMRLPAPFRSPPQRTIPAATGRPGPSTRPPAHE